MVIKMDYSNLKIPNHLGIIVDGNGRWAKARGKKRSFGHKAGFDNLETIVKYAVEKGVKVISLYVFSTENFKRSKEEVDYLMKLFTTNFKRMTKRFDKENIKVLFSGRQDPLKDEVYKGMQEMMDITKNNDRAIVNFCLNYGGKAEIVDATKKISYDILNGNIDLDDIYDIQDRNSKIQEVVDIDYYNRIMLERKEDNYEDNDENDDLKKNEFLPDLRVNENHEESININDK